jgi:endogenous inhibitor of DNA gyrase (YacG/DUF329 family)
MSPMCDATCPQCGKRIGWAGEPRDRPPCSRCGHKVDPDVLAHDQALIDELREMTFTDTPETKSGRTEQVWIQDYYEHGAFVYCGRKHPAFPDEPGTFGNPFGVGAKATTPVRCASVAEAVGLFRRWLEGDPEIRDMLPREYVVQREEIIRRLPEIRGKRLGCWRHPPPCHSQVLAELADGPLGDPKPQPKESDSGKAQD